MPMVLRSKLRCAQGEVNPKRHSFKILANKLVFYCQWKLNLFSVLCGLILCNNKFSSKIIFLLLLENYSLLVKQNMCILWENK